MTIKNSNVTINVKNLEESISFYESIGLAAKSRWGNHYAQVVAPGITIGLHPSANLPGNSGNTSIGFTIDNFEEVQSSLQDLSIKTTTLEEEGGSFIFFNDPDGTALYFIKPKW